jgi:hypothetical protein
MYKAHPNLFLFLENLKEFQMDTYVKIQSLYLVAKINNKHVRDRQKFINNMIKRHNNKELSRLEFLKCVPFHCNLK